MSYSSPFEQQKQKESSMLAGLDVLMHLEVIQQDEEVLCGQKKYGLWLLCSSC